METTKEFKHLEILDRANTFYAKKFQGNGFYPLEKFVWDESEQAYIMYWKKESGWYTPQTYKYTQTKEQLKYMFEHNLYKVSEQEMFNEHEFDLS